MVTMYKDLNLQITLYIFKIVTLKGNLKYNITSLQHSIQVFTNTSSSFFTYTSCENKIHSTTSFKLLTLKINVD